MTTHTPTRGPLDVAPDNPTVQNCCLAYGGSSFPGPMKEALICHLGILKHRYPAMNAYADLVAALRCIAGGTMPLNSDFEIALATGNALECRRILLVWSQDTARAALALAGEAVQA